MCLSVCRPAPRGVSASLDENRVCEFMGSVALLCHQQRDDSSYGSPHGSSGSLSMGGGGWLPPRNPASPGRVSPSSWSSSPQQSQSPLALACAVEQCCVSTGPATASMELFENERHAPFVGWSASHLLPYERGPISNEAGSVTLDEALRDVQPPVAQDFVWDGGWELEKEHTPCDEWGWSYGLSWWILALRLRHGNSTKERARTASRGGHVGAKKHGEKWGNSPSYGAESSLSLSLSLSLGSLSLSLSLARSFLSQSMKSTFHPLPQSEHGARATAEVDPAHVRAGRRRQPAPHQRPF